MFKFISKIIGSFVCGIIFAICGLYIGLKFPWREKISYKDWLNYLIQI